MALYTVQEVLQMRAARIAAQEASEASKKQRNPVMSSTISQCPPRHSPDNQTRMEYVFGVLVYLSKARDQDGELTKHIIRGITYSASLAVIESWKDQVAAFKWTPDVHWEETVQDRLYDKTICTCRMEQTSHCLCV